MAEWQSRCVLTNEIVGFSNVVIPNSDLQGLLGQVPMLNLIAELLVARRGESRLTSCGQAGSEGVVRARTEGWVGEWEGSQCLTVAMVDSQ